MGTEPSSGGGADFDALMARAAAGDRAALGDLARQYEAKVRVVARLLLGRPLRPYVDSVDLVQSVHQSVLIGLRRQQYDVSDPDKLTALAVTVVRRKVARHWRKLQRQRRLSRAGGGADDSAIGGGLEALADAAAPAQPDAAADLAAREQVAKLCRSLNDADRQLLDLQMRGQGTEEIAAATGMTAAAVRVRLSRLRQKLRHGRAAADWL